MDKEKELTLKEIQNGSYEVLKKIKKIFDENNFRYYLIYGTLIGAARHNDFIPWDDDIDIWIPRPDYEKFIDYCIEHKEELSPLELIHYKTNDKYIYPIARMSDSRYNINYENAKDYGLGLFVDIYPVDGFNPNDLKQYKKLVRLNKLICLCGSKKMIKSSFVKNIFKFPYYHIVKHLNLPKILEKNDKASQKYAYDDSDIIACSCWLDELDAFTYYEKKDFGNGCELKFRNLMFKVPCNYDKVLRKHYGDYMKLPPEEERVGHHFYKAYKKNSKHEKTK